MTGLYFMLKPLEDPLETGPGGRANRKAHSLGYLLLEAARLHFDMRREPDTIYYFHSQDPGAGLDVNTEYELLRLPAYNMPEQGNPKLRIHIVLAPGIIALRKFGHISKNKYEASPIAHVLAAAEYVSDDQLNRAPLLSQNIQ